MIEITNEDSFTKGEIVDVTYLGDEPYKDEAEILACTPGKNVTLKFLSGVCKDKEAKFVLYFGEWKWISNDLFDHPSFSERAPGYFIHSK